MRFLAGLALTVALSTVAVVAQAPAGPQAGGGRGRGAQGPPPAPRAAAPFDPVGYWVSVVTEDWRWRMVTPQKGDYPGVPMTPAARQVADSWDLAKDRANGDECKAFGAAGLIRIPMRMHITWQDDNTLKIDTDAGQQTRQLHFGGTPPAAGERTWQGYSTAEWYKQPQAAGLGFGGGGGRGVAGGNLRVVTSNMKAGYLRKNGVPYSENAVLTEYINRHDEPNGDHWLMFTSVIDDPKYLNQPFILSTSFKQEADGSKFHPTPCEIDPPRN